MSPPPMPALFRPLTTVPCARSRPSVETSRSNIHSTTPTKPKRPPDYTTTYSCGYTDLIFCHDDGGVETAFIQLSQYNYTVKRISYEDNKTILLADADVFRRGNDGCPVVLHNVSFGPDWLRYEDSSHDNLTFFLDCYPDGGDRMPEGFDAYHIVCSKFSRPVGIGATLVFSSEQQAVAQEHDVAEHCREVFVAPVLRDSLYGPNKPMLPADYGNVLSYGFQLEWYPMTTDQCQLCERSGGRCSYSQNKSFLGCLCSDKKVGTTNCSNSEGISSIASPSRNSKRTKIIYTIASVSCVLPLCLIILTFCLTHKYGCSILSKNKDTPSIESFLQKNGNMHPKRYTYTEVKRMTKSFAVKLGQGGFGAVYRGNLPDGREVAVKMLKDTKGDGEEFMNEVSSISRTSHVNVVSLLGFCLQGSKRALLYEYMSNGSLERYAFNNNLSSENTLTWEKLFEIAIGIARGLEYLHRGCNTRIVHFDIKPHNILLDHDFCPKISDFGLSKLCLNKESAISIVGARGTIGYIAPEVYSKQFGTVSSKSDVYSYGMMVLEMVGARDKKTNINSESSSQYFPQWIYEHLDDYCISASEINGETTELVRKMIVVGLWCIQVTPTNRPTMTRVVEMLEGSTSILELPPKMLLMS